MLGYWYLNFRKLHKEKQLNGTRERDRKDFKRINRHITITPIRLIGSNGDQIGIVPTYDALRRAEEQGMDLVEIVPSSRPPVCQIMDYGKFKYEQSLKEKEQQKKNKQLEMKEVRMRPVTSDHDLEVKINMARKFLEDGRAVQLTVVFKRRELMFRDQGIAILKKMIESLKESGTAEKSPNFTGKFLMVRLKSTNQP
jgi:translation initiation factor IF-3